MELLDSVPDFFYQVSTLEDEVANECRSSAERRSATRVAMTQAHVLLLPSDAVEFCNIWPGCELETALTGLRQRIPAVAIYPPGAEPTETPITKAADFTVGWNASEIACTILQVVEAEACERRRRLAQLDAVADVLLSRGDALVNVRGGRGSRAEIMAQRSLPVGEIASAYNTYRAAREGVEEPDSM